MVDMSSGKGKVVPVTLLQLLQWSWGCPGQGQLTSLAIACLAWVGAHECLPGDVGEIQLCSSEIVPIFDLEDTRDFSVRKKWVKKF